MFCLYTLPLARPAQAKIQMLTAICSIVYSLKPSKFESSLLKPAHCIKLKCATFKARFFVFMDKKILQHPD